MLIVSKEEKNLGIPDFGEKYARRLALLDLRKQDQDAINMKFVLIKLFKRSTNVDADEDILSEQYQLVARESENVRNKAKIAL